MTDYVNTGFKPAVLGSYPNQSVYPGQVLQVVEADMSATTISNGTAAVIATFDIKLRSVHSRLLLESYTALHENGPSGLDYWSMYYRQGSAGSLWTLDNAVGYGESHFNGRRMQIAGSVLVHPNSTSNLTYNLYVDIASISSGSITFNIANASAYWFGVAGVTVAHPSGSFRGIEIAGPGAEY